MEEKEFKTINNPNLTSTLSALWELNNVNPEMGDKKVSLALHNIEGILNQSDVGLKRLYRYEIENREKYFDYLQLEINETRRRIEASDFYRKERLKWLNIICSLVNEIFEKPISPVIKLQMNISHAVLYDLFRQLKNTYVKDGKTAVLSQTYEELAEFIKMYIAGFEETTVKSISKAISKKPSISKESLNVETIDEEIRIKKAPYSKH